MEQVSKKFDCFTITKINNVVKHIILFYQKPFCQSSQDYVTLYKCKVNSKIELINFSLIIQVGKIWN